MSNQKAVCGFLIGSTILLCLKQKVITVLESD
jgi:hypothetical protein